MFALQAQFDRDEPCSFTLAPHSGCFFTTTHLFRGSEWLYHGESSDVFYGRLGPVGSDIENGIEVVCKFSEDDLKDLENEAFFYTQKLKCLQGRDVPHCYGFFKSSYTDQYDGKVHQVACILLEYFENTVDWDLRDGPLETRIAIYKAMKRIHAAGVEHCDFHENNVLVNDEGQVRIIDFNLARGHVCECKMKLTIGTYGLSPQQVGCSELHEVCEYLHFWTPTCISFRGSTFCIWNAPDAESLAELYIRHESLANDPEYNHKLAAQIRADAKRCIDRYYALYGHRFNSIPHPRDYKKLVKAGALPPPRCKTFDAETLARIDAARGQ